MLMGRLVRRLHHYESEENYAQAMELEPVKWEKKCFGFAFGLPIFFFKDRPTCGRVKLETFLRFSEVLPSERP